MPSEASGDLPQLNCPRLTGSVVDNFTINGQRPRVVLLPETEEELAAALRQANSQNLAVSAFGGGTLQHIGYPPEALDVVLVTNRLNRILIYEPGDLTISVQAGCTIDQVRTALAEHGQMLPFDTTIPEKATYGGLIATNLVGPRRFGLGSYRDLLIGITVAYPDGTIAKAGGQVVKNVSGYDLMKLHLGALGTLGVILRLNFKVLTQPAADGTAIIYGDPETLSNLALQLATSSLALDSIEISSPHTLPLPADQWALSIRATGSARGVARKLADLRQLAQAKDLPFHVAEASLAAALWNACAAFYQSNVQEETQAVIRLAHRSSELTNLFRKVSTDCARANIDVCFLAHAGSGITYLRLNSPHLSTDLAALWPHIVDSWRSATLLTCPTALKRHIPLWGELPSGFSLMQRIKREFDPKRTLNRGRFIGHL